MGYAIPVPQIEKPVWIALVILGFIAYWPIGLAILALGIWSRQMHFWRHRGMGRGGWSMGMERGAGRCGDRSRWESSGNRAFDDYRTETLKRLEDEKRDFAEFLDRLRFAKDKAEFDDFLADRRRRRENDATPAS
jgi:hypothetical protein